MILHFLGHTEFQISDVFVVTAGGYTDDSVVGARVGLVQF